MSLREKDLMMPVDPISFEIFKNILVSIPEEMGSTLQRSAFSPNIRERLDFSCAIFDPIGRMIGQAAHIPVHLGSMPASVEQAIKVIDEWYAGDVVVLNDPYHGGTHLPDVTMVSPIFLNGTIVFFVASRAHHADIGGMSPGSLPLSTELYQEGLIIPPVKLANRGETSQGVFAIILANSRSPHERKGDISAQLAAHKVAEIRLRNLIDEYGISVLHEHSEALINYSKKMTTKTIERIPEGIYTFEDVLESDGQTTEEIKICVSIAKPDTNRLLIDFSGSAAQVAGNVNAVASIIRSATWYCIRLLSEIVIPMNHGCFSPIEVRLPSHSVVNPDFPAAVSVGNTETGQRIVDVVLGALAKALPDLIPAASQGTMNNLTIGGVNGKFVYYETIAGGHGASPAGDGLSGRQSHMTNTLNTPIESVEQSYPIRVLQYALRDHSGGSGQFSGGMGIVRHYEFLDDAHVTINSERRQYSPYGLHGGQAGKTGRNIFQNLADQKLMRAKDTWRVTGGDKLIIETPGGGGWGSA